MQTDYEDYDDYDGPGLRWMSVVILLLAIAGFFSLAWYAYYTGTKSVGDADGVIIIEADTTPIKEEPENAGGMEFPHQDKTIYNAVEGSIKDVTPKPIAKAEKPVIPEDMPAKTTAPKKRVSADDQIAKIIEEATKDAKPTATIDRKINKPVVQPKPELVKPISPPQPKAVIATAPKPLMTTSSTSVSSSAKLQLGAFRSHAEAEATWSKIRRSHLDILDGAGHQIVRADLGAKGVYYRLRVSGVDDISKACATLKARNQACFIVK